MCHYVDDSGIRFVTGEGEAHFWDACLATAKENGWQRVEAGIIVPLDRGGASEVEGIFRLDRPGRDEHPARRSSEPEATGWFATLVRVEDQNGRPVDGPDR